MYISIYLSIYLGGDGELVEKLIHLYCIYLSICLYLYRRGQGVGKQADLSIYISIYLGGDVEWVDKLIFTLANGAVNIVQVKGLFKL